jgi:hypothetical protein
MMTVEDCIFGHGNANGKREYLSTTVSIYALRVAVGSGPLKSILSRLCGFDEVSGLLRTIKLRLQ